MNTLYKKLLVNFLIITLCASSRAAFLRCRVTDQDWLHYKKEFHKNYSIDHDQTAREIYTSNLMIIHLHNKKFDNHTVSYRLTSNQFTDMTLQDVQRMFPKVREPKNLILKEFHGAQYKPTATVSGRRYNLKVHNQGLNCNSGWAFAASTVIDSCRKKNYANPPQNAVSAQYFIDCAGGDNACKNQHQLTAFKYYQTSRKHYYLREYPLKPLKEQCDLESLNVKGHVLTSCKQIVMLSDNDADGIKEIISSNHTAVGVHFGQISFEFLHYSKGVFTPEDNDDVGSHFLAIVGYGINPKGMEYWRVQNSFGSKWGIDGNIRLAIKPKTQPKIAFTLY